MEKIEKNVWYTLYVKRKSIRNRSYELTLAKCMYIDGVWYVRKYYQKDGQKMVDGETGFDYKPLDTSIFEVVRYAKEKEQDED